ncbi:MAG: haloacid dehalogenase, partial [Acidobacteria bacterium]
HVYGTEFSYGSAGEIERIVRTTAGHGKVSALDQLQNSLQIGPDHIIYMGDGSSDIHVMLHVNARYGYTIAASESKHVAQIANRTVLSDNALAVLVPVLEKIVGWQRPRIRDFFESYGLLIQEWDRVRTDWLTLRPAHVEAASAASAE